MNTVDGYQRERQERAALARTAARGLVGLYLTDTDHGTEPQGWRRAVAGAMARTVPIEHVADTVDEVTALITRWAPGTDRTAGGWRREADRLLDRLCPAYHRDAARQAVGSDIVGAADSAAQILDAAADKRGAVHGLAASAAAADRGP